MSSLRHVRADVTECDVYYVEGFAQLIGGLKKDGGCCVGVDGQSAPRLSARRFTNCGRHIHIRKNCSKCLLLLFSLWIKVPPKCLNVKCK